MNYKHDSLESRGEEYVYAFLLEESVRPEIQWPIGKYFADFAYPDIKLVLEYDGAVHQGLEEKDKIKTDFVIKQGWDIVRIKVQQNKEYQGRIFQTYQIEYNGKNIGRNILLKDYLAKFVELVRNMKRRQREHRVYNTEQKRREELNQQFKQLENKNG